jgi:hypothetical protein
MRSHIFSSLKWPYHPQKIGTDLPAIRKAFDALLMLEGLEILLREDDAHSVGDPDDETH